MKLDIKIGDIVSYTFGHIVIKDVVLKIRGNGDNKEAKLKNTGWVAVSILKQS